MDSNVQRVIKAALEKVGSAMSVEEVIGYALQEIRDVAECRSCGVITVDEDGTLRVKSSRGLSGEFIKRLHAAGRMPLVDEVMSLKGTLLLGKDHPKFNKEGYILENSYKALLAIPLIVKGQAIGAMLLDSAKEDAFPQGLRDDLKELASILALAAYQGLLEDGLARASNYDAMTSFHNYRYFHEQLAREIQRAHIHNERGTIMLASIGHIGEYNSMYGHPEGDKAIIALSALLKRHLRPIDIASRYSNKFAVILPELDKPEAERMARRLCDEMTKNPVGKEPALTMRIGIASYPTDASDLKGMINAVEKKLHESKRKGGNSFTS